MVHTKKIISGSLILFLSLKLCAQILVTVPHDNWNLIYVDSEESALGRYGSNVYDDDITTIWHTQWQAADPDYPHELIIDMGDVYNIAGIRYLPRQDGGPNGTIIEYDFFTSLNGTDWDTAIYNGVWARNTSEKETLFNPVEGRYIRFVGLEEINYNPWASCAELNVLYAFTGLEFVADKNIVSIGEAVHFTDLSGNSPTAWEWIFEGGNPATSNEQNPEVVYNDFGEYSVWLITTSASGNDTLVKPGYISVGYCIPQVEINDIYIDTVWAGSILNSSGPDEGIADYTHLSTEMYRGASYPIFVHYNNPWNSIDTSGCWIDWNNDGAFDLDNEFVLLTGHHSVEGVITVPEDAVFDTVRMRILARYWRWPPDPCEDIENGEIEDYSIVVKPFSPEIPVAYFEASKTILCAGDVVNFIDLSLNTPNFWSWEFEGGVPDSGSFQTQLVRYPVAGSFMVSLTVSQPSGTDKITRNGYIIVYGDTSITRTGNILLANATDATYQWINCSDSSFISGATNHSFEASENGSYAVIVTQNGCTAISSCYIVNITGINDEDDTHRIRLYPNPNTGSFHLGVGLNKTVRVEIYNASGNIIYSNPEIIGDEEIQINIKGVYYVKVYTGKETLVRKVVVN